MFLCRPGLILKSQVEEDEQELWAQGAQDGIVEYR